MKFLWLALLGLIFTACDYTEVEREIGYKGKARTNPWLAAEKFSEQYEGEVISLGSWKAPQAGEAVWFTPASILSNESFTRSVEQWINEGGHLILLVEHANADTNDWSKSEPEPRLEPALIKMLERSVWR
jgi:hypothetical protein